MTQPTDRDFDLMEIALDVCANTCQAGATLRNQRNLDPLAAEYLRALAAVRRWRKSASPNGVSSQRTALPTA